MDDHQQKLVTTHGGLVQYGKTPFQTGPEPGVYGVTVKLPDACTVDRRLDATLIGDTEGLGAPSFVRSNPFSFEYAVLQTDHRTRRLDLVWSLVPEAQGYADDHDNDEQQRSG